MASTSGPIPIGTLPAYHAARAPNRPMITYQGNAISRSEFDARTNRLACALSAQGVSENDFVTVALPNGSDFYELTFAIWKLGATPNAVSPKLTDTELREIVNLLDPRLIVGLDPRRVPGHKALPMLIAPASEFSSDPLPVKVARYWKAMTSGGSTGRPKIIVDHNPGVAHPMVGALGQEVNDTLLNVGPLYHNAPFLMMHSGLFVGGHVVESGKFDALQTLAFIERYGVNWVNFVPTMMQRIFRLPRAQRLAFNIDSLRVVFHMAAPCPVWLKEAWIEWLGPERIFELYGGTERVGRTIINGTEWLAHRGSVGRIQLGAQVRILDASGQEVPVGEIGEVFFLPAGGRGSTYHYIGAEPRLLGEWESLGDLGYLDVDGYLYLADRRTDMIISGGANIYPAEVEAVLNAHPDVETSVVVGLPDEDLGQIAHAIVQLHHGAAADGVAERLKQFLGQRLVRYKIPRTFEIVLEPLRDEAGKTRRASLREARTKAMSST